MWNSVIGYINKAIDYYNLSIYKRLASGVVDIHKILIKVDNKLINSVIWFFTAIIIRTLIYLREIDAKGILPRQ